MEHTTSALDSAGCTDVASREDNEDSILINDSLGLFVLADGVGGASAGAQASRTACDAIERHVARGLSLEDAVQHANAAVRALGEKGHDTRVASTVVAVRIADGTAELAWVGDSRIYCWDGQLKLLTKDHSYVQKLVDWQLLDFADAPYHPKHNVITQALGAESGPLKVGLNRGGLASGQTLLLCSDGVSDELHPQQLVDALQISNSADITARHIVDQALQNGGQDNASCIVIRICGANVPATEPPPSSYWRFDGEAWQLGEAQRGQSVSQPIVVAEATRELPPVKHTQTTKRPWWGISVCVFVLLATILALLLP